MGAYHKLNANENLFNFSQNYQKSLVQFGFFSFGVLCPHLSKILVWAYDLLHLHNSHIKIKTKLTDGI